MNFRHDFDDCSCFNFRNCSNNFPRDLMFDNGFDNRFEDSWDNKGQEFGWNDRERDCGCKEHRRPCKCNCNRCNEKEQSRRRCHFCIFRCW